MMALRSLLAITLLCLAAVASAVKSTPKPLCKCPIPVQKVSTKGAITFAVFGGTYRIRKGGGTGDELKTAETATPPGTFQGFAQYRVAGNITSL
jgi:hypothetical protein